MDALEELLLDLDLPTTPKSPNQKTNPVNSTGEKDPDDNLILYSTEVLESKGKNGDPKYWIGHVISYGEDAKYVGTRTESWHLTSAGNYTKRLWSEPRIVKGKNIGRSNETTPLQQGIFNIETRTRTAETSVGPTKSMLAEGFTASKVVYPCTVETKYDGLRCAFNSEVGAYSRQRKMFSIDSFEHLFFDTQGLTFDGELFLPKPHKLQTTLSAATKYGPLTKQLTYKVYDLIEDNLTYPERKAKLEEFFANNELPEGVTLSQGVICNSLEEIVALHEAAKEAGEEGVIVRLHQGGYRQGKRVHQLMKLKDRIDDEFKIVDVWEGEGSNTGAARFRCVTAEGKVFTVQPQGTYAQRSEYFRNKQNYIGRLLTVEFQCYTADGIPFHPSGKNVRDADLQ